MIKFLLFLYAVSVVVFFAIFVALGREIAKVCERCGAAPLKVKPMSKFGARLLILLVAMLPVFRVACFFVFAYTYCTKSDELERKENRPF